MLIDSSLTLLSLRPNYLLETHSQIKNAPRKEVVISFFYGALCTQQFYSVRVARVVNLKLVFTD